tara:strand:- start:139 stop:402 length:264 start_codon:yes stop_codon:yes gene_type:complete
MRVVVNYTTSSIGDYDNDSNRMYSEMENKLLYVRYYMETMIHYINIETWKREYKENNRNVDFIFVKVTPDQIEIENGTVYLIKYFAQ